MGLQAKLLLKRSWRQIARDKATNVSRAMSNISSAIIFGSIYWRLGRSQISIQDRMGLLQVRLPMSQGYIVASGLYLACITSSVLDGP